MNLHFWRDALPSVLDHGGIEVTINARYPGQRLRHPANRIRLGRPVERRPAFGPRRAGALSARLARPSAPSAKRKRDILLTVKMLGGLTVMAHGQRLRLELGCSGRLLAAYLLQFAGRVHRRERLAGLFWHDLDDEHARAALNTALWRLRKLITPEPASHSASSFYSTAAEVVLEPAAWLSVDTHRFDAAVHQALDAHASGEIELNLDALPGRLRQLLRAFPRRRRLGLDSAEREKLHSLYVRCLGEIVRADAIAGRYELAIAAARRILCVDPFRESIQRQLALLLTLNGQRAQAILGLRRWTMTSGEIGIGPMPETDTRDRSFSGRICNEFGELKRSYFCNRLPSKAY